jgi:transposase
VLKKNGKQETSIPPLTDRAYSDFKTRYTARDLCFKVVVPSKVNMVNKQEYDMESYKKLNEIEHSFRRIKAFRTVFTRYDKLDTSP